MLAGCTSGDTVWKKVLWQADLPAGTAITVYVRTADTIDGLKTALRYGPFNASPIDLSTGVTIKGRYIAVEATLTSNKPDVSPVLKSITAQYECTP